MCLSKRYAIKTYWGMEVQHHAFFDLGTRWRWVVSFTPRPLYSWGKSPLYPLDRRLGGAQWVKIEIYWDCSYESAKRSPLCSLMPAPHVRCVDCQYLLLVLLQVVVFSNPWPANRCHPIFFLSTFPGLQLCEGGEEDTEFWGGEPMLQIPASWRCICLTDYFICPHA
jgi:hypothetical protein